MSKIILCGGGTGGHIYPNIALLPRLQKEFDEIHYIGRTSGLEYNLLKEYPFVIYHGIDCVKLQRSFTLKNLAIPFKLLKSINQCKKLLAEIKPNVIFAKGGYVSLPVVLAGKKIPVVAHESDITMGLANKIIYKKCKAMCFSFYRTYLKYHKKGIFSGSPIREQIKQGNKITIAKRHNLSPNKPTVLFIGGSLGATAINKAVCESIKELTNKYNIIHITGKNKSDLQCKDYLSLEYVTDIENYYAFCDMVVGRSGSNVIFEILSLKKPMLLIPLPTASSRGDQILNAKEFEKNGWASILFQEDLTTSSLLHNIDQLWKNKHKYIKNMANTNIINGNKIITDELKKYKHNRTNV